MRKVIVTALLTATAVLAAASTAQALGTRTQGNELIPLPASARLQMSVQRLTETQATVQLILSRDGRPTSVNLLRSSGFPEVDSRLVEQLKSWRYEPLRVNGTAVPFSTQVTFRYLLI